MAAVSRANAGGQPFELRKFGVDLKACESAGWAGKAALTDERKGDAIVHTFVERNYNKATESRLAMNRKIILVPY